MPSPSTSQYPASLDNVQSLMQVVNNYATTLATPINTSQTTISLISSATLQAPGTVSINSEVIYYAAISGNDLVGCLRAFDGTTATAGAVGDKVEQRWVAVHHNLLASAIAAIERTLGAAPAGTSPDVATLLANSLPLQIPFSSPLTDWSFTHTRGRLVNIQLWRATGVANTYELFEADIEQVIDPSGTCLVNITLSNSEQGFAVIQ